MKIVFAGTAEFAVPSLLSLIKSQHTLLSVLTQPDRPAGRGQKLNASAVKHCALTHDIPVQQPDRLQQSDIMELVRKADALVVVAYGLLIPKSILQTPRYGCINVHPSLLPRWRGAAPIQHTLLNGDTETGVSIIQMNEKMDAGDILKQSHYTIQPTQTSADLHDILSQTGATLLLETLAEMELGKAVATKQNEEQVTLASKFNKHDAEINWQRSAKDINNQVRAYNSWPVAFTHFQNKMLRIWTAEPITDKAHKNPGTLIAASKQGLDIATGDGMLRVMTLQLAGGKCISAQDFINAHRSTLIPGETVFL